MTVVSYAYANARIKAMKSQLLERSFYEQLLRAKNVIEVVVALERTVYGKDIHEGVLSLGGAPGVEEGLRRNIVATFHKLLILTEGRVKELVKILLGRWDVHNLKTIIRGKHIGATDEEIFSSLVPAGELHEATLTELISQPDLRSVIDLLATWGISYSRPLTQSLKEFTQTLSLSRLELSLDRFYYEHAFQKLRDRSLDSALVREVLSREIDLINIMTLLRLVREEVSPEEIKSFFISGGKELSEGLFLSLAQEKDIDEIIFSLEKVSYGRSLSQGWQIFLKTGAFSAIERSMEEQVIRKSIRLFRADPLSIAVIIGYIWAKFNEVVNLRIIVRGKEVAMPEERIKEALVLV